MVFLSVVTAWYSDYLLVLHFGGFLTHHWGLLNSRGWLEILFCLGLSGAAIFYYWSSIGVPPPPRPMVGWCTDVFSLSISSGGLWSLLPPVLVQLASVVWLRLLSLSGLAYLGIFYRAPSVLLLFLWWNVEDGGPFFLLKVGWQLCAGTAPCCGQMDLSTHFAVLWSDLYSAFSCTFLVS